MLSGMRVHIHLAGFVFVFALLLPPATHSQTPSLAPPPTQATSSAQYEFAVATIKPDKSEGVQNYWRNTPDGFTAITPPIALVMSAYEVKMPQQVVGLPGWASSEPLAIEAKMDSETAAALAKLPPEEQWKAKDKMLQALLADRLGLKVHRTTKEMPVYVLTVVDAGKLKKSVSERSRSATYAGKFTAHGISIDNLALNLTNTVGRTVVNETGLAGTYDFTLEWAPQGADASDPRPSIFTALEEQMGLKLKPAQGPVDAIVVDSITRPSEN
jgi:uncharacterized protein (TIGR03435 family)